MSGSVLDACGRRCLKTDHFVRQLQLSDTGVSGGIAPKRNITPMSRVKTMMIGQVDLAARPLNNSSITTLTIFSVFVFSFVFVSVFVFFR